MESTKNKKIKLLFLTGSLVGGGKERAIINLISHLNKDKFDISLALLKKEGFFLNIVKEDVRIIALTKKDSLKNRLFLLRVFRYVQRVYTICKIINSEKPDFVICGSSIGIFTFVLPAIFMKLLLMRKTKVIEWLHEHPRPSANIFEKMIELLLIRLPLKYTDKVISPTTITADAFSKIFNVPRDKINVIPNMLEIEKINKLKNEEICDDWFKKCNLKIISVGNLYCVKGFNYLISAFKIVRENGINANLIILGDGIKKKDLEDLTKNLGLENYVIMPGFKENPYKYMRNSDIFVLSSLSEAFSYVVIEAMACGVPVIATRCKGPEEIITHNINGVLVPVKDEKALAEAIINLLKDREKMEKLVKEGKKRAEYFDIKEIVQKYEKVFGV